jgi:hypothetical protein
MDGFFVCVLQRGFEFDCAAALNRPLEMRKSGRGVNITKTHKKLNKSIGS